MFAYCGNNPVNYEDSSGTAYQGFYRQINYNEHDHTYGGHRENFYGGSLWESDPDQVVQDRLYIQNGTVSLEHVPTEQITIIANSYLIQTTQVMKEYLASNGMDHVSGSAAGVLFEWMAHNLGYNFGNGLSKIPGLSPVGTWLSKKGKDVSYGATIYDDKHHVFSVIMWTSYMVSHPKEAVQDLQIALFE